jgi:hypothetical protein
MFLDMQTHVRISMEPFRRVKVLEDSHGLRSRPSTVRNVRRLMGKHEIRERGVASLLGHSKRRMAFSIWRDRVSSMIEHPCRDRQHPNDFLV